MRDINYIVVHCTATQPEADIEAIKRYWKNHLGWSAPGYHYMIKPSGEIVHLLPTEQVSNGVAGFNSVCVNVAYIGGIDQNGAPKDTRTAAQKEALGRLLSNLKDTYPTANICGHRDFKGVKKACPSFDAKTEYQFL